MSAEEECEEVAPGACPTCGYVYWRSLEKGRSKCPHCGACVECV